MNIVELWNGSITKRSIHWSKKNDNRVSKKPVFPSSQAYPFRYTPKMDMVNRYTNFMNRQKEFCFDKLSLFKCFKTNTVFIIPKDRYSADDTPTSKKVC